MDLKHVRMVSSSFGVCLIRQKALIKQKASDKLILIYSLFQIN